MGYLRLWLRYERLRAAGRRWMGYLRLRLRYERLRAAGRPGGAHATLTFTAWSAQLVLLYPPAFSMRCWGCTLRTESVARLARVNWPAGRRAANTNWRQAKR